MRASLALLLGCAGGTLAGCLPSLSPSTPRRPVRWIVVEMPVGEVIPGGQVGDGQIDPGAVLLTMQPLGRDDLGWRAVVDPCDGSVEVLEISPGPRASPGETVTAKVRVARAAEEEVYRLVAKVSRPEVQLIGAMEWVVQGGEPAWFRFTSRSSGRGGIEVRVENLGSSRRPRP